MVKTILFQYFPIFLALYILTKHFLNKILNLPPSPFPSLPIIGHLHLLKPPLYRTLSSISSRNGPVLLLQLGSRRVLLVSSPSAAEECFTKNDVVFANRPRLIIGKHMAYNYTGLSWAPYGDHWRNLRRIASVELLSSTRLHMLSNIRADEVRSLTDRLFRDRSQIVNLKMTFFDLTMNIMMRMIAGKRYYGDDVADLEEAGRFKSIHRETFRLAGKTNIQDFLPWIKTRKLEKGLKDCHKKRDEFMQFLIEERRGRRRSSHGSDEKPKTLIDILLGLQDSDEKTATRSKPHHHFPLPINLVDLRLDLRSEIGLRSNLRSKRFDEPAMLATSFLIQRRRILDCWWWR